MDNKLTLDKVLSVWAVALVALTFMFLVISRNVWLNVFVMAAATIAVGLLVTVADELRGMRKRIAVLDAERGAASECVLGGAAGRRAA